MCPNTVATNDRALRWLGISIPSACNRCPAFDKDKCLEPMFGDAGHARTKAAILLLPIATTSSRTCTKPIVSSSFVLAPTKQSLLCRLALLVELSQNNLQRKMECCLLVHFRFSFLLWQMLLMKFQNLEVL